MKKGLFNLDGKVAVVTGGMGQLGQQFCCSLAEHGARVVALDVCESPKVALPAFEKYCEESKIVPMSSSVVSRKQLETACKQITEMWDVPSILVNNAALDSPPSAAAEENGPFETFPESSLDKILEVNVKGVFLCCQVFGNEMLRAGRGSIINIGSIYGLVSPNQDIYEFKRKDGVQWFKPAPYALSKASVMQLTRYLATYWARKNVRVNTLTPSGIYNGQDQAFLDAYCARIPIGRMARSDEMNGALVFLASDASSYMTGSNLVVDGGWTAW